MEDEKEKKKQQHIEKKEKELNNYYLGLCIGLPALLALFFVAIYMRIFDYIQKREDFNNENKKKYIIISGVGVFAIYVIGTYFIVDALIKERDKNIAITKTDLKKIATI